MEQKQELANRTHNPLRSISFQQKSNALSLVITGSVASYFFANSWSMRPAAMANEALPAGFANLVLSVTILFILAQIVLQIVLAFGSGSAPAATAHERAATLRATRNAYAVLGAGLFAAVGAATVTALPLFYLVNLLILGFLLAEIVKFSSQLVYVRR